MLRSCGLRGLLPGSLERLLDDRDNPEELLALLAEELSFLEWRRLPPFRLSRLLRDRPSEELSSFQPLLPSCICDVSPADMDVWKEQSVASRGLPSRGLELFQEDRPFFSLAEYDDLRVCPTESKEPLRSSSVDDPCSNSCAGYSSTSLLTTTSGWSLKGCFARVCTSTVLEKLTCEPDDSRRPRGCLCSKGSVWEPLLGGGGGGQGLSLRLAPGSSLRDVRECDGRRSADDESFEFLIDEDCSPLRLELLELEPSLLILLFAEVDCSPLRLEPDSSPPCL